MPGGPALMTARPACSASWPRACWPVRRPAPGGAPPGDRLRHRLFYPVAQADLQRRRPGGPGPGCGPGGRGPGKAGRGRRGGLAGGRRRDPEPGPLRRHRRQRQLPVAHPPGRLPGGLPAPPQPRRDPGLLHPGTRNLPGTGGPLGRPRLPRLGERPAIAAQGFLDEPAWSELLARPVSAR